MISSIPSPGSGSIELGPISLNAYGLMIALGVVAAVWLFGRRLEERGIGTRDDASAIGLGAVLAGVVGARLYHVITDWERFDGRLGDVVKIWEGGLGIPGGLLVGIPFGIWLARRRGLPLAGTATAAAPALPLAQAIGRWGNWFNQELFGRPTDLPWALEIDAEHLPAGSAPGTTFHPAFLYESLWNLGLFALLMWIDRRYRPAKGRLLAMYLVGYGVGRFWIEGLRIDTADELGPFRWNQWVALAAVVGGAAYLVATRGATEPVEFVEPDPTGVIVVPDFAFDDDLDTGELDGELDAGAGDAADAGDGGGDAAGAGGGGGDDAGGGSEPPPPAAAPGDVATGASPSPSRTGGDGPDGAAGSVGRPSPPN